MTATYTLDPTNVPVDAVRLMIGDTNISNASLQDEEIQYFINRYADGTPTESQLIQASVDAIRAIIAKVETSLEEEQAGQVRVRLFNRINNLLSLIESLEKRLSTFSVPKVFAGGIDKARFENNKTDPTTTKPQFTIGMHSDKNTLPDVEE